MNVKHLALVRIWTVMTTGWELASIVTTSYDQSELNERLNGEKCVDQITGECATYFIMPYEAAAQMIPSINDDYDFKLKTWRYKVYGEPKPTPVGV